MNRAEADKKHTKSLHKGIERRGPMSLMVVPAFAMLDPAADTEISNGIVQFMKVVMNDGRPLSLADEHSRCTERCAMMDQRTELSLASSGAARS